MSESQPASSDIAIIGMACRFPGAANIGEFWKMLADGTEAISFFSEDELIEEGIPPEVVRDSRYIPAKGIIDGPDLFDAGFFGYSPKDAASIDPQQRLFLECAWEALEHAAIDPGATSDVIGVYAGSSGGSYLARSLRELAYLPEFMELVLGNDKDQLATRTSYKLNLKGPSICVQSACSTALVAVHLASQGLLSGDCDLALAGAASVMFPRREGYLFHDEGIYAHDGHCRAFDVAATGTVPGDGVGVVVLKLLTEALRDGDPVHAVIKGTAVNNDGAAKAGFSAPGIAGQTAVIRAAHQVAGVDPASISYVEAHGTGTALGDQAEITGLTRAFRSDRTGFCAIGSVKTNIGHLDVAAGVAGLIKTVLALEHQILPPSLHFSSPNPATGLDRSPFFVNASAAPWPASAGPRRAGVSSFGLGGTNAHAVLEEAPAAVAGQAAGGPYLLLVSARSAAAADKAAVNLAGFLDANPAADLADVAHTTQVGRRSFPYRRFLVCTGRAGAIRGLTATGRARRCPEVTPPVAFMLPGQGAQYPRMGAGLYEAEPAFREEFDACCSHLSIDLREVVFPGRTRADAARLDETEIAQPALFAVEYALARLLQTWGVAPSALIGHSVGEYVAACLAGVFTLGDALLLVARRGQLMRQAGPGAMISVQLPEAALGTLPDGLSVAAVNGPDLCAVAGPEAAIGLFEQDLAERGVAARRLRTSRAFHSAMMTAAADELRAVVAQVPARPPRIPFISNVTGDWITDEQATDPGYWAEHTLRPVRFADGLTTLLKSGGHALLEVGPGRTLATLARQSAGPDTAIAASMRHPRREVSDQVVLEEAVGSLWSAGVPIDWRQRKGHQGRRVALPSYPFERQRYWHPLAVSTPVTADAAEPVQPVRPAPPAETVPPADDGTGGEVGSMIAAIWADLLGVPRIAPDDDFFLLGGHSLLGTRLTTRLREAFGVEVRLRDLFDLPTLAEQAELVATLRQLARGSRTGREHQQDGNEEGEL